MIPPFELTLNLRQARWSFERRYFKHLIDIFGMNLHMITLYAKMGSSASTRRKLKELGLIHPRHRATARRVKKAL